MNEQELRDALHAEVDDLHPAPDAYARLGQRLGQPSRRPVRGMVLAGVAVVLVAALVGGVLVAIRHPRSTRRSAAPPAPTMLRRILAVTTDFRLVVLDSHTGAIERRLASGVAVFRGLPELAASPDGSTVYYTAVDPVRPPGCDTSGRETVFRRPTGGGPADVVARGRTVAVGPTGRIAASRDHDVCTSGPGMLRIDGAPVEIRSSQADLVLADLRWTDDGKTLTFNWAGGDGRRSNGGGSRPYALTVAGAKSVDDATCICGPRGAAVFGSYGSSSDYLATVSAHDGARVVVMQPDGGVARTLFRWDHAIESLHSDGHGNILMTSPTIPLHPGRRDALYRWRPGGAAPVKVRDGVIAAAWIPDPPSTRTAGGIALVGGDTVPPNVVRVLDPSTGRDVRRVDGGGDAVTGIAGAPGGAVVAATTPPGASGCDGRTTRIGPSGDRRLVLGEATQPVVDAHGLAAYAIHCDGVTLGFSDLRDGRNFRSDPLGHLDREGSDEVTDLEALGWSPDGEWLAYRLKLGSDPTWQYYAGRLWPAVRQARTEVVSLPSGPGVTAATMIDDERVALAEYDAATNRTEVRVWRIHQTSQEVRSVVSQTFVGRVTELLADPSGSRLLALVDGRLVTWTRGDRPFQILADGVTAASWIPRG